MIYVISGNNDFLIEKLIHEKELLPIIAEETTPEQIWQQSLFVQNKVIKDFNKWSPKQQKEFVSLEHEYFDVYIVQNKVPAKSVLKDKPQKVFNLPNNNNEWHTWIKDQAIKKHKLLLNSNQIKTIFEHTGANVWAIDSELDRINLFDSDGSLPPVISKITEVMVWGWLESFFAKDINSANHKLQELEEYSPFLLISHLGGRLLGQILFFDNPHHNNLTYYQKKSSAYAQQHGWDLETSRLALKDLIEFETKIKGEYSIESFTALILWQNKLLAHL